MASSAVVLVRRSSSRTQPCVCMWTGVRKPRFSTWRRWLNLWVLMGGLGWKKHRRPLNWAFCDASSLRSAGPLYCLQVSSILLRAQWTPSVWRLISDRVWPVPSHCFEHSFYPTLSILLCLLRGYLSLSRPALLTFLNLSSRTQILSSAVGSEWIICFATITLAVLSHSIILAASNFRLVSCFNVTYYPL